jgi:putative acetyltransferase
VFTASFGTLAFLPRLHTPEEDRAFFAERVVPEQDVLVAEENGSIVGFVAMSARGFVEHMYVDPSRVRRGIGTALLERAKQAMPDGFRLWVFQQNEPARRFYERHGLVMVEETDGSGNEEKTPDVLYEWSGEISRRS